jgi:UDP-glucose 4-epimerase
MEGCTIRIYDNLRHGHLYGLMDLPSGGRYEFIEGDILDRLNLTRAMQGVHTVVHLAAIVRTPLSFHHPESTEQVNRWGTASVVDCALEAGVERLVYTSSASVYGPGGPFVETDACRPVGPYSVSKHKGEQEVLSRQGRGLEMCVLRLGTVFGNAPAMRFNTVISRFVYAVGVGRPMTVYGDGRQVRPFIHVRDASAALRLCMTEPACSGQILNAAAMNQSVIDIAHTLQALVPTADLVFTDQDVLNRMSFQIDASRLEALGFAPRYDLGRGLEEMLARWHGFQPALHDTGPLIAPDDLV